MKRESLTRVGMGAKKAALIALSAALCMNLASCGGVRENTGIPDASASGSLTAIEDPVQPSDDASGGDEAAREPGCYHSAEHY